MDRKSSVEISDGVPKVLSFFSGAMGLDIGMEMAGFKTLLACEVDKSSRETILQDSSKILDPIPHKKFFIMQLVMRFQLVWPKLQEN